MIDPVTFLAAAKFTAIIGGAASVIGSAISSGFGYASAQEWTMA